MALDASSALLYLGACSTMVANNIINSEPASPETILQISETASAFGITLSSALGYYYKQQKDYTLNNETASEYIKNFYDLLDRLELINPSEREGNMTALIISGLSFLEKTNQVLLKNGITIREEDSIKPIKNKLENFEEIINEKKTSKNLQTEIGFELIKIKGEIDSHIHKLFKYIYEYGLVDKVPKMMDELGVINEIFRNNKSAKPEFEIHSKLAQTEQVWKKQLLKTFEPIKSLIKGQKPKFLDELLGACFTFAALSAIGKSGFELFNPENTEISKIVESVATTGRNLLLGAATTAFWLMDTSKEATAETFKNTLIYKGAENISKKINPIFKTISSSQIVSAISKTAEKPIEFIKNKIQNFAQDFATDKKTGKPLTIGTLAFKTAGISSLATIAAGAAKITYASAKGDSLLLAAGCELLLHGMTAYTANQYLAKHYASQAEATTNLQR